GGDHARLGFHLRSEALPVIDGRRGAHETVGHHAEDAALQLTIKTVEHREHDDERHDAERHAQQGKGGYEGYELVAPLCTGVAQANQYWDGLQRLPRLSATALRQSAGAAFRASALLYPPSAQK